LETFSSLNFLQNEIAYNPFAHLPLLKGSSATRGHWKWVSRRLESGIKCQSRVYFKETITVMWRERQQEPFALVFRLFH
jgi:hypothetical protein